MDSRDMDLLNTFICQVLTDCLGDELKERNYECLVLRYFFNKFKDYNKIFKK